MNFEEIKVGVEKNLRVLHEVMEKLNPKVTQAQEIIKLTVAELSKHPSLFYKPVVYTVHHKDDPKHCYKVELWWGEYMDELRIEFDGQKHTRMGVRETLLLADFMVNITGAVVKDAISLVNTFPTRDKLKEETLPEPKEETTNQEVPFPWWSRKKGKDD